MKSDKNMNGRPKRAKKQASLKDFMNFRANKEDADSTQSSGYNSGASQLTSSELSTKSPGLTCLTKKVILPHKNDVNQVSLNFIIWRSLFMSKTVVDLFY